MSIENNESHKFVPMGTVLRKLGQMQYVSRFLNPDKKLHDDGTPYFSDIRINGNPDDYHNLKIHSDDIKLFAEKWFEYQKSANPFFFAKSKLEDYL